MSDDTNDDANLPATVTPRPPLTAGRGIKAIIPTTMDEAFRLGNAIWTARMNPDSLKTAEMCCMAIMTGMEIGMPPMQAVNRIAVINGRPTIWGDAAIALVRASRLAEYVRERIEGEGDDRVAICVSKRRDEDEPVEGKFSVEQAKTAKLWGKDIWAKYPERMLQMRARAFCLRDLYADVLGGLSLREEFEEDERDTGPAPTPPAMPAAAPKPAIEHKPQSAPQPQPESPEVEGTNNTNLVNSAGQTVDEVLSDLSDKLGYAKTVEEVDEFYDDFDADAELSFFDATEDARALRQTNRDRVGKAEADKRQREMEVQHKMNQEKAAKVVADEKAAKAEADRRDKEAEALAIKAKAESAPTTDPFEPPPVFKNAGHYALWIGTAIAASSARENANDLRRIWADTKKARAAFLKKDEAGFKKTTKELFDAVCAKCAALEAPSEPAAPRTESSTAPVDEPVEEIESDGSAEDTTDAPVPAAPLDTATERDLGEDKIAGYNAWLIEALKAAKSVAEVDVFLEQTAGQRRNIGASDGQLVRWQSMSQSRRKELREAKK